MTSRSFMDAIRSVGRKSAIINEGAKDKTSDGMTKDAKRFAQDLHKVQDPGMKHLVQKDSETKDYEKMFKGGVEKFPTRLADMEPSQSVDKYVEYNESVEEAKKLSKKDDQKLGDNPDNEDSTGPMTNEEKKCGKDCKCEDCKTVREESQAAAVRKPTDTPSNPVKPKIPSYGLGNKQVNIGRPGDGVGMNTTAAMAPAAIKSYTNNLANRNKQVAKSDAQTTNLKRTEYATGGSTNTGPISGAKAGSSMATHGNITGAPAAKAPTSQVHTGPAPGASTAQAASPSGSTMAGGTARPAGSPTGPGSGYQAGSAKPVTTKTPAAKAAPAKTAPTKSAATKQVTAKPVAPKPTGNRLQNINRAEKAVGPQVRQALAKTSLGVTTTQKAAPTQRKTLKQSYDIEWNGKSYVLDESAIQAMSAFIEKYGIEEGTAGEFIKKEMEHPEKLTAKSNKQKIKQSLAIYYSKKRRGENP